MWNLFVNNCVHNSFYLIIFSYKMLYNSIISMYTNPFHNNLFVKNLKCYIYKHPCFIIVLLSPFTFLIFINFDETFVEKSIIDLLFWNIVSIHCIITTALLYMFFKQNKIPTLLILLKNYVNFMQFLLNLYATERI